MSDFFSDTSPAETNDDQVTTESAKLDLETENNSTDLDLDLTGCKIVTTKYPFLPWDNPENIITAEQAVEGDKVLK